MKRKRLRKTKKITAIEIQRMSATSQLFAYKMNAIIDELNAVIDELQREELQKNE